MSKISATYLLCFYFAVVSARNAFIMDDRFVCTVKTSCFECLKLPQCSWCPTENKCFSKSLPGYGGFCSNDTIAHVDYGCEFRNTHLQSKLIFLTINITVPIIGKGALTRWCVVHKDQSLYENIGIFNGILLVGLVVDSDITEIYFRVYHFPIYASYYTDLFTELLLFHIKLKFHKKNKCLKNYQFIKLHKRNKRS